MTHGDLMTRAIAIATDVAVGHASMAPVAIAIDGGVPRVLLVQLLDDDPFTSMTAARELARFVDRADRWITIYQHEHWLDCTVCERGVESSLRLRLRRDSWGLVMSLQPPQTLHCAI
jgi:hypothetical protein